MSSWYKIRAAQVNKKTKQYSCNMWRFNDMTDTDRFPGVRIFQTDLIAKGAAIALPGIGILVSFDYSGTELLKVLQHEYGHIIDARQGIFKRGGKLLKYFLFYVLIGIPSLASAIFNKQRHRYFWTEIRANKIALTFFANDYLPDEERFPLISDIG
jgi:hypothetical protein